MQFVMKVGLLRGLGIRPRKRDQAQTSGRDWGRPILWHIIKLYSHEPRRLIVEITRGKSGMTRESVKGLVRSETT